MGAANGPLKLLRDGLMEKETNKPVFPNAEIVVSDAEYKFWTDPAVIDRLPEARKGLARRIQAVFPTWKNIRQVEGEPEVAPGIRLVNSPGHTPGHRAFHLSSGSSQRPSVICGGMIMDVEEGTALRPSEPCP